MWDIQQLLLNIYYNINYNKMKKAMSGKSNLSTHREAINGESCFGLGQLKYESYSVKLSVVGRLSRYHRWWAFVQEVEPQPSSLDSC